MTKKDIIQNFTDFQSFNEVIGKQSETINLFLWAEENVAYIIPSLYIFVRDDLFDAGKFDVLNKYINPVKDYESAVSTFTSMTKYNNGVISKSHESIFITEIQQLVIILHKNNRTQEARDIISKAALIIKDPRFKMAMESNLGD
ncbi:MAG: hypothetical protein AB8B80_14410 [Marinicellaceae bacterium]